MRVSSKKTSKSRDFLFLPLPAGEGEEERKQEIYEKKAHPNPRPDHAPARRFGVTRAAVSKRIIRFCERLALPEARGMKKAEARDTYRQRQRKVARGRHRPKGAWRHDGILKGKVHEHQK